MNLDQKPTAASGFLGKVIRSYDFMSTQSCYYEGVVTGVVEDGSLLMVKSTRRVWGGEEATDLMEEQFYTPAPGQSLTEWDGRIIVLEEENAA